MSKERNTDFTLNSLDDLFTSQNERDNGYLPNIQDIPLELLDDFPNHPFKVRDDEDMLKLIESVSERGVLVPAIVRPKADGRYELISGHRRKRASECAEKKTLRCMVSDLDDDAATIIMVDSNIQRTDILPSEKAFAYKMKYDVLKKRGVIKNSGRVVHKPVGKRTIEVLAEEYGESPKQIQRYLKLTELIPDLLSKLDDDELSISAAVEIAFLKKKEQKWFLEAMDYAQATPSLSQAQRIKRLSQNSKLSATDIKDILCEIKRDDVSRVTFKTEQLRKYFPKDYTVEMIKREVIDILKIWMERYWES